MSERERTTPAPPWRVAYVTPTEGCCATLPSEGDDRPPTILPPPDLMLARPTVLRSIARSPLVRFAFSTTPLAFTPDNSDSMAARKTEGEWQAQVRGLLPLAFATGPLTILSRPIADLCLGGTAQPRAVPRSPPEGD